MVRFAYALPTEQPGRWKVIPLSILGVLAALALVVSLGWIVYSLVAPFPGRKIAEAYYFLLPLGILTSVGVFAVRAVQLDERPPLAGVGIGGHIRRTAAILLRPAPAAMPRHIWSLR